MDFQKEIQRTNEGNHFMLHNGIRLTRMERDHGVVELEISESSKNLFGAVHGGVFLTMADCAAGAAARSTGVPYVTLSNNFEFFRNTDSPHIRAESHVRHRGRTICFVAVDVLDDQDRLLASGTFTMFATGTAKD